MYRVTYKVKSLDIQAAANAIAIGQSIGNPTIRNSYENINHAAEVLDIVDDIVTIGYKYQNLHRNTDVAQILCTIQGGQSDIDLISECKVIDIDVQIPDYKKVWTHITNRPLIGGIVKPKAGLTEDQLVDIVTRMCDGGIDWIKEDEILSDPSYLPVSKRVELISKVLEQYPDVMYCVCVNGGPRHYLEQIDIVKKSKMGIHTNFWSGLGSYEDAIGIFQHFQRSGIRILTDERNPFSISWEVITKLAVLQGIDSIHAGMIGGYYPGDVKEVYNCMKICNQHNRIPTLSCGMNPDVAKKIKDEIGNNWLAAVGGWLHTGDITDNVRKMRKAVE